MYTNDWNDQRKLGLRERKREKRESIQKEELGIYSQRERDDKTNILLNI